LQENWRERDHVWVALWGTDKTFDHQTMILVDEMFLSQWPMIRHEQQTRKLQANLNSITSRSLNLRVNNGLKIITWNINSIRKR